MFGGGRTENVRKARGETPLMGIRLRSGGSMPGGSVYRHLEQEWVDWFFETGKLRLTTLETCRNHENPTRRDPNDGLLNFSIRDGSQMLAGLNVAASRSYVLCASISPCSGIQDHFSTDSLIEIEDVEGFANAVGNAIHSTGDALIGDCRYVVSKEVNTVAARPLDEHAMRLFEAINNNPNDLNAAWDRAGAERAELVNGLFGEDDTFFKKDQAFEGETEFRFVWPVGYAVRGPKEFSLRDAVKFCRRGPPAT
jgi:hypothetical protein